MRTLALLILTLGLQPAFAVEENCSDIFSNARQTLAEGNEVSEDQVKLIVASLDSSVTDRFDSIDQIKDEKHRTLVQTAYQTLLENADQDAIHDSTSDLEGVFSVGEPEAKFIRLVYSDQGILLGGGLSSVQSGGAFNGEPSPKEHYDTPAEAIAAGGDTTRDVSWQVSVIFVVLDDGLIHLIANPYADVPFAYAWTGW